MCYLPMQINREQIISAISAVCAVIHEKLSPPAGSFPRKGGMDRSETDGFEGGAAAADPPSPHWAVRV